MKRFWIIALSVMMLAAVLLLTGCSSVRTLEEIKSSGEIVMYTNAAFAPFEYMQGENIAGVDVDIAQAIADELGVKLRIENVEFDSIILGIKSGKGDFGAAGITVRPDREENVAFSVKYVTSKQYIILEEDAAVETIEDLKGMKIGVQTGTTGDFTVTDAIGEEDGVLFGMGAEVQYFDNALDASLALKAGKLQAVVIDELPAKNIAAVNEGLKAIELVYADGQNTEEQYAIAVNKKNTELLEAINTVLTRLIEEGKIDEFVLNHTTASAITE